MLAHVFIELCLTMVRRGLTSGVSAIDNALARNQQYELAYPGLVCILFDVYCMVVRALEQIRRIYQFITAGISNFLATKTCC